MAVRIRNSCCPCDCWALSAVPWKLPRTLVGMAMSASACSMTWRACASEVPGSMLNEMVVASSPSWWLMDVGEARSTTRATALSGTMVDAAVLMTLPVDAPRWPGLAAVPVAPVGLLAT